MPASPSAPSSGPSVSDWISGARPRTLPAAIAPVLAGTGVAAYGDAAVGWKALLAAVVALALQVGVNYANDYSDGIRGTDDDRVGPLRLVGSGIASPRAVKTAAFTAFGVAGVAGAVLAVTTAWWLLGVGIVCVLAAWFYTGGRNPYGYLGLGEVMVFVFFGLVATVGTTFVQVGAFTSDTLPAALYAGGGIGALACAILVANNLRDVPTDTLAGKRTLAVRLGESGTRWFYVLLVAGAGADFVVIALLTTPWTLLALVYVPPAAAAAGIVARGARGADLIPVLARTGVAELLAGIGLLAGFVLG